MIVRLCAEKLNPETGKYYYSTDYASILSVSLKRSA